MKPFRITADARADLKGIYRYIAFDNRPAAIRQIARLYARFALLATQPLMGELRSELAPHLRSFVVGNYVILYRPVGRAREDLGIEIARVLHALREIGNLFRGSVGIDRRTLVARRAGGISPSFHASTAKDRPKNNFVLKPLAPYGRG